MKTDEVTFSYDFNKLTSTIQRASLCGMVMFVRWMEQHLPVYPALGVDDNQVTLTMTRAQGRALLWEYTRFDTYLNKNGDTKWRPSGRPTGITQPQHRALWGNAARLATMGNVSGRFAAIAAARCKTTFTPTHIQYMRPWKADKKRLKGVVEALAIPAYQFNIWWESCTGEKKPTPTECLCPGMRAKSTATDQATPMLSDSYFLHMFWMYAAYAYLVIIPGGVQKSEFRTVVAIPDPIDIQTFLFEHTDVVAAANDEEAESANPLSRIIYSPAEGGYAAMRQFWKHTVGSSVLTGVDRVDVLELCNGKSAKCVYRTMLVPDDYILRALPGLRKCRSSNLRARVMHNLLHGLAWYTDLLDAYKFHAMIQQQKNRKNESKKSDEELTQFRSDVTALIEQFSKDIPNLRREWEVTHSMSVQRRIKEREVVAAFQTALRAHLYRKAQKQRKYKGKTLRELQQTENFWRYVQKSATGVGNDVRGIEYENELRAYMGRSLRSFLGTLPQPVWDFVVDSPNWRTAQWALAAVAVSIECAAATEIARLKYELEKTQGEDE